jgi:hypothetical protein
MTLTFPTLIPAAWGSGSGINKGLFSTLGAVSGGVLAAGVSLSPSASLYDGFPIIDMTNPLAGGVPPAGADFNGAFALITGFQAWVNAGGKFPFNATLAAAIGGYQIGNVVQLNTGLADVVCTTANNSVDPNTQTATQLAANAAGWMYYGGNGATAGTANTFTLRDANGALTANGFFVNATGAGGTGDIFFNSTNGLSLEGKTGSTYDAAVLTPSGAVALGLLTGTNNLTAPGQITASQFNGSAAGLSGLPGIIQGQRKNLRASALGTGVTVTETVDAITLTTAAGAGTTIGSLSLSAALTTSGLNGLDNATPQACTISVASPAVVTLANHGFLGTGGSLIGQNVYSPVVFAGTVPTGLTAGTTYYVLNPTANTFNVSATPGGAAINTTAGTSSATVASALAGNCWYSKWIISNGTTPGILFSASATNPNLPTGYTYKCLTGWVYTDNVNKYPTRFNQAGTDVEYAPAASGNLINYPMMISGTSGNPATPTLTAVPIAGFVPPNVAKIKVAMSVNYGTGQCGAGPASYYSATAQIPLLASCASSGGTYNTIGEFIIQSSNFYYASSVSGGSSLCCLGFSMNL